jgi:PAS domain S-box-containing protein
MSDTTATGPQRPNPAFGGAWHWPVAGIRTYLGCIVLAVLLPLVLILCVITLGFAESERRVLATERLDVTSNLNNLVDRELERISGLLTGLAAAPDIASARFDKFQAHADAVAATEKFERIFLTDRAGQLLSTTPAMTGTVGFAPKPVEPAIARRTVVSGIRSDLGIPYAFLASVAAPDGAAGYVVHAVVSVDRMQVLFAEAGIKSGWLAAIVDQTGLILARSRAVEQYIGKPARETAIAAATGMAAAGQFENVTLDGASVATSFQRSTSGWTSMVAVPLAVLSAPRHRALTGLVLGAAVLGALGLALAYALGNRIAIAANALRMGALDVVEGRRPALIPMPIAELRDITTAFDYASAMTRERRSAEQKLADSEERLRLAIDAGAFGTWDLDLNVGQAVWSDACYAMLGYEPAAAGFATPAMWLALIHDEDRAGVLEQWDIALEHPTRFQSEHRILRADTGELRWLRKTGQCYHDATGRAVRFIGVVNDITARKLTERQLRESQTRYGAALLVGKIGSWETHLDTGRRIWTDEGQALFGLSLTDGIGRVGGETDEYVMALHPDDRYFVERFRSLADAQDSFAAEYRIIRPDGKIITVAGRGQVTARDGTGRARKLISVVADITERKAAEQHVLFLMRESAHRSKNLLSVVQSIARQTVRSATSLPDFTPRFLGRLQGLAASIDILILQDWQGAMLEELVRQQTAALAGSDATQLHVSGPVVRVDANGAQAIGLALHELATNAIKYGALSTPAGKVSVTWGPDPDGDGGVLMKWIESGGPPVITPTKTGFGHTVIATMAAQMVGGSATLTFAADGVHWSLHLPASALQSEAPLPEVSRQSVDYSSRSMPAGP